MLADEQCRLGTPASLAIECLNPDGDNILDPVQFAAPLAAVPCFVEGTAELFIDWMKVFNDHCNELPPNDQQMCLQAGCDPSIYYHNSAWPNWVTTAGHTRGAMLLRYVEANTFPPIATRVVKTSELQQ